MPFLQNSFAIFSFAVFFSEFAILNFKWDIATSGVPDIEKYSLFLDPLTARINRKNRVLNTLKTYFPHFLCRYPWGHIKERSQ